MIAHAVSSSGLTEPPGQRWFQYISFLFQRHGEPASEGRFIKNIRHMLNLEEVRCSGPER